MLVQRSQVVFLEGVDNAVRKRCLRSDNRQSNFFLLVKLDECWHIGRGDIHVFPHRLGAGIAWRDENAIAARTLSQLQAKACYAASISYDEYVHGQIVIRCLRFDEVADVSIIPVCFPRREAAANWAKNHCSWLLNRARTFRYIVPLTHLDQ